MYILITYSINLFHNPIYIKHELRQQDKSGWSFGQRKKTLAYKPGK